jgi:hypothetical protein
VANQDRVGRLFQQVSGNQKAYQVLDDRLVFVDPADTTKRVRLDAGGITTATTRVITAPDYDFSLGGAGTRQSVLLGSGNLTLTAAMSGAVIEAAAAEDYTLPALSTAEAGVNFEFVVITTATSLTITAATGDLLVGGVSVMSTSAGAENDAFSADGTDDLIFTMNGTTQGGIIGSWVKFTAGTTGLRWLVRGGLIGSGTLVTPFS